MSNLETAQQYKRQTASRYLPVGKEEITSKIIESDNYAVSNKYDGHLYLLSFDGEKAELINHGGNVITDLPMLQEANELLKSSCKEILFDSDHKFESGSGWPSFFKPEDSAKIIESEDNSWIMKRTEIICATCDAHLGHVFTDGPNPTGLRYCVNGAALEMDKKK